MQTRPAKRPSRFRLAAFFVVVGAMTGLAVPVLHSDPRDRVRLGANHLDEATVTLTASAVAASEPAGRFAAPTVTLYGDSLASESQTFFRDALVGAGITDVHTRTFGGTAPCDWLDEMRHDAGTLHPNIVVIEFAGNALTPCMHDANDAQLTGGDYYAKYFEDTTEALSLFLPLHARVYLVGAPLSRHAAETHNTDAARLNALYAELSAPRFIKYVDAGAAVLDHGAWTSVLPCLPDEPCTGGTDAPGTHVNVVRAADGMHFCPAPPAAIRGVSGECPVWSSGAFRFGTAMAKPVIRDLRA
jgi:hypothetical protein